MLPNTPQPQTQFASLSVEELEDFQAVAAATIGQIEAQSRLQKEQAKMTEGRNAKQISVHQNTILAIEAEIVKRANPPEVEEVEQ